MYLARFFARVAGLSGVILTVVNGAHAATVVMTNGERFSGDVVSMIDGELIVKNQYAGEITLP